MKLPLLLACLTLIVTWPLAEAQTSAQAGPRRSLPQPSLLPSTSWRHWKAWSPTPSPGLSLPWWPSIATRERILKKPWLCGEKRVRSSWTRDRPRSRFSRDGELGEQISFDFGSGVVIGTEGQILTAYHVVKGASAIVVRAAERQQFDAEIIAADPRIDLAVIVPVAIPGLPIPGLQPIRLGDSTTLRKGSFLVALGNPFNAAQDGKPSASWGILSNVARKVEPEHDETGMFARRMSLPNYPHAAPARFQAQPGHERWGGRQHEGRARGPDHDGRQPGRL